MTQKEFKLCLQRGQGRALQAVRENPTKYYKLVIWACGRNLSFDTQCEGTRSWYLHQMTNCFEDKTSFVQAALASLKTTTLWNGWQVQYLSELLLLLSEDGYSSAIHALWDKYEELYEKLLTVKRLPKRNFYEKDCFEMLSLVLAHNETAVVKIADDIGKLYENVKVFNSWDFSWLYSSRIKPYKAALKKHAKTGKDIQRYLQVCHQEELRWAEVCSNPLPNKPKTGLALSVWLRRKADKQTILQYAKEYIRHPKVRDFALENLGCKDRNVVSILIKNYLPQDEKILEQLVKQIPIDLTNNTGWHSIHLDVLNMVDDGVKAPALRQMVKQRIASADILKECLVDSNEDIRKYAQKILKNKEKQRHQTVAS